MKKLKNILFYLTTGAGVATSIFVVITLILYYYGNQCAAEATLYIVVLESIFTCALLLLTGIVAILMQKKIR